MKVTKYKALWPLTSVIVLCGMVLFLFSCEKEKQEIRYTGNEYQNILQYIHSDPSYSSFQRIVEVGRLTDVLSSYNSHPGGNGFTLFLPNNDAVDRFIDNNSRFSSLEELLQDTVFTRELARYHVLNVEVLSSNFANGALPDKTLSDDILTIIFIETEGGEIIYSVNNESGVSQINIEKSNGVIHIIDKMLSPVIYTGYEWVQTNKNKGYKIFSELLEITGLEDTMNYYLPDDLDRKIYNKYTLFVESDELYSANDISSLDDLIELIGPEDNDFSNPDNSVNKFARYHIISGSNFLDEFKTSLYSTYGDFPVSVDAKDLDLKFNEGTQVFDILIIESDTIEIDYLKVDLERSNILTKTGAIHQLDQVLHPFLPGKTGNTFEFYEEYQINILRDKEVSQVIRKEDLDFIDLLGIDFLTYTNTGDSIHGVTNEDYITLEGNFEFIYRIPKVLPGTYEVSLVAKRDDPSHAILGVYLDGQKLGSLVDLTGGSDKNRPFLPDFVLGTVYFNEYETHEIKLQTRVPGRMQLDRIMLKPAGN